MATTNFLGLYLPIGVLKATATTIGTTTTLLCADADAVDVIPGAKYHLFNTRDIYKEKTLFTVIGKSSSAGTTTISFAPAAAVATAVGDKFYQPEVPNVTTAISNQFNQLDGQIQCFECTSLTQPTPPQRFTGMLIYETDTASLKWWNGSSWQQVTDPSSALGHVGNTSLAPGVSLPTNAETFITSTPVILQAGRRYLVKWTARQNSGAFAGQIRIRYAAGGSVTTSGTLITRGRCDGFVGSTTMEHNAGFGQFVSSASGAHTVGMFLARLNDGVGAGVLTGDKQLSIEDIGV